MRTTRTTKIARLAMALVLFTGTTGSVIGGQTSASKSQVAKVIDLHAPNSAASSVVIWTPKTTQIGETSTTVRSSTAQVINLHASNNPATSITIWTRGEVATKSTDKKFDAAPLK